ncbi:hypothetical protein EVAR_61835_1 [Eumeta japonica]|uniref:Uncharacterized protein n=1 Tax=Eumeta variegata TaxID=151549 RepID=A0A4C1YW16_EUMVA|nr:hypothetical protein EVAR_61835_1 [Eumeta japonica]
MYRKQVERPTADGNGGRLRCRGCRRISKFSRFRISSFRSMYVDAAEEQDVGTVVQPTTWRRRSRIATVEQLKTTNDIFLTPLVCRLLTIVSRNEETRAGDVTYYQT